MKILVLGSRIPYPLHDGGAIATYNMLKSMAELGHEITYFSFNTKKHYQSPEQIRVAFPFCRVIALDIDASVKPVPALLSLLGKGSYNLQRFSNSAAAESLVKLLQEEKFDLIHFEGLYTVSFLAVAKSEFSGPIVFRAHNVEHLIWETLASAEKMPVKKQFLHLLARRLKRKELTAINEFRALVAITEADNKYFDAHAPGSQHFVYPAGFDLPELNNAAPKKNTLFHIGSMEWQPNVQGVEWLVREVFPRIRAKNAQAELHLAGKGLKKNDPSFQGEGIFNHGEVEDSGAFISAYSIMCVPLKSGSGLRMKTLEAMSNKRAVVSTSIGADGLSSQVLQHIGIADNAADFSEMVLGLLIDEELYEQRTNEGYNAVKDAYSPLKNTRKLLAFYEKLLA